MQIPPSLPPQSPQSFPAPDPIVDEFQEKWNSWFTQDHSKEKSEDLLDFISKNADHFKELGKLCPPPPPKVSIDDAINDAKRTLSGWIDHGCDGSTMDAPSEFIADIDKWINYAK